MVKLNDEEVAPLCECVGIPPSSNPCAELREAFDLEMVAVTRGSEGSRLYTAEAEDTHPGVEAEVKDTVGAGDAFAAALCTGLSLGLPLQTINDWANRVAAYVCTQEGGTPSLPRELRQP